MYTGMTLRQGLCTFLALVFVSLVVILGISEGVWRMYHDWRFRR